MGGSFTLKSSHELTLWLDASDTSTVTKVPSSNDMQNWRNKIDPAIQMRSINRNAPLSYSINSKSALRIDNNERFTAYKNGTKWNPAGENGKASGLLSDVAIFFVWRVDKNGRTTFLSIGEWEIIFLGKMGRFTGDIPETTEPRPMWSNRNPVLIMLEYSVSKGIQKAYKWKRNLFASTTRKQIYKRCLFLSWR